MLVRRHLHRPARMDARRLFAFSTWRIARVERPLVVIGTDSGQMTLTFTIRDLARGCPLGRDRVNLDAACPRWQALHAAVGGLDVTPGNLANLADAEVDAAIDPVTGYLTYRAVPELAEIRADEARRRACSATLQT